MPDYRYFACDAQGRSVKGRLVAANLIELESSLKRRGLDLVSGNENRKLFFKPKIRSSELINFFFQLEQLSRAGVPLLDSLSDLRDSLDKSALRETVSSMLDAIENGLTLSQAMAQHPQTFDRVSTSLVNAAEQSGQLPEIFQQLTETFKWRDELQAKTRQLMLYPLLAGSVLLATTFFLMIYLVPQLLVFINSMGHEIPLQTRILLAASSFVIDYWPLLLATPLILLVTYKSALHFYPGLGYHADKLKLQLWPIGPVLQKIILARFARTFAMMYSAGISVLECLANSRELLANQYISRSLEHILSEIESGKSLTQGFEQSGIFPSLLLRMLKVGEASGQLELALLNVCYFYQREVDAAIKKTQAMLEPAMTIALGLLLGWVMLSVLSPIYDIIGQLKI